MERNCWYCHKPLPLTKLLTKDLFCSAAHEEQYFDEQNAAAFARMKEPEPPVRLVAKPADPAAVGQLPVLAATTAEETPPPMAPLLELLPNEALPPELVPQQDPITPVGTPVPPRGNWTRTEPVLAIKSWIRAGSATPPPLAGIEGGFGELPFESNVALPVEPAPLEPLEPLAISSPPAPYQPVWTARAGDQAMDEIAPASSIDAEQSPRISGVEGHPLAHLRSNSADGNTRLAPIAQSASLMFVTQAPQAELSHRVPGVQGHPLAHLHSNSADGHTRLAPIAQSASLMFVAQAPQAELSPRVPGVQGHPLAHVRSNSADGKTTLAPIARSAPLMFVGSPAFQDYDPLPQAEIPGVEGHPLAHLRSNSADGNIRLAPIARSAPLMFATSPAFQEYNQLPEPEAWTPNPSGLAACGTLSQGLSARREAIENPAAFATDSEQREAYLAKGDAPGSNAPRFRSSAAWGNSLPATESEWKPIFKASWTNPHNPTIAVRSTLDADVWRNAARRPANADVQEIIPAANGRSVIQAPALAGELASEGTLRMLGAQSEIAAPLPVEAGANIRPSLTARDCQMVSMTPNDSPTPVRAADFQSFSFTPVPQVGFAGATSWWGTIAKSSLPEFIHASQSEPNPASLMAEPRAFRLGAATLDSASRVDHPWQAVRGGACRGPAPSLDREGARAFRIPKTVAAKPAGPALRVRSGMASKLSQSADPDAKRYVPTAPPVRIDPASILASPACAALPGGTLARIGGSPAQFRFFAMRKLVAAPFQGVLRAAATPAFSNSIGPAQAADGLKLRPVTRGPGRAPLFALEVPLQQVVYERGRRIAEKVRL